jgi:hypothetical protein
MVSWSFTRLKHGWDMQKDYFILYSLDPLTYTCWNLITHLYWKFALIHSYIHYKNIILCIECQIWTSLKIPTKSLKKNLRFMIKKGLNTHNECLNNFFWHNIFTTNTLCVNGCKMYECGKNQMPNYNVIFF